ncbi:aldolase/citrate lyase family protein [Clostridium sporogenes]
MKNNLIRKIKNYEKTLGTFMELDGESIIECIARGGFDYLIVDAEHGPFSVEKTAQHVLIADKNDITPLVRICEISRSNINKILAVDGVDGIFVGPCDLSIAMRISFEFDSPILKKAISDILDACNKAKKLAFIFVGSPEIAKEYFDLGFDSVTYSLDVSIFVKACNQAVLTCKVK